MLQRDVVATERRSDIFTVFYLTYHCLSFCLSYVHKLWFCIDHLYKNITAPSNLY